MHKFRQIFRFLITSFLIASAPVVAQNVTAIRDTVYNADNSKFNGLVIVSWKGFTTAAGTTIAPHSTSIIVRNGYLSLLLVPTTNASPSTGYSVQYESNDGLVLWTEYWQVPPSLTVLKLSQVRVSGPPSSDGSGSTSGSGGTGSTSGSTGSGGTGSTGGTASLPIREADVTSLPADLAARPQRSSNFTNSRVAMIDGSGNIGSISGNNSDCIHVDGSTGTCGGSSPAFIDNETPSGALDGVNTTFTLSQAPAPAASLAIFRNGMMQRAGADYTLSGASITFTSGGTPQAGDILVAFYRITGSGPTPLFSDAETPAGTIDGVNAAFTLASAPAPVGSLQVFKNGALLRASIDFTLNGNTIVLINGALPHSGDSLVAFYRH